MSYVPSSTQLRGVSYEQAELFGKPHLGCFYAHDDVHSHKREDMALCAICGKPATNAHHEPPLGMGGKNRHFVLATKWGQFVLKPALFALCGSGTTGCHGKRHTRLYRFEWHWDSTKNAKAWWSGKLLKEGMAPHSEKLFELGYYLLIDDIQMTTRKIRGTEKPAFHKEVWW